MKREYFAYGSLLEALSFGLYPDKRHVLREFIQNAFDAINDFKKISEQSFDDSIEIKIEPSSIFIADKGMGMDETEVKKYRFIGYSEKDGSKTVGFRGIGKDSGLSVAEKIIVTTSKNGIPKQYMIVIDAKAMLDEISQKRNPPLDEILEKHSDISENHEKKDAHYTFVELHKIRKDAKVLFEINKVKEYISRNCPVSFDPNFKYAKLIETQLKTYVSNYSSVNINLNGECIFKPFSKNYSEPEYEHIFKSDEEDDPVAFCWYCGNTEKGQFADKENSGLVYRVKNFSIGDRFLTRNTLWLASPERAFYFFGEIHLINPTVIPSTDRTNFEDNEARERLYDRCRRIAQVLNRRALIETDQRRFEEKTEKTGSIIIEKKRLFSKTKISDSLKSDIEFQIKKSIEDLEQRLKRVKGRRKQIKKDKILVKTADRVVKDGQKFLKEIASNKYFYKIEDLLEFNKESRIVYNVIINCIRDELKNIPELLERLITKIDQELMKKFTNV